MNTYIVKIAFLFTVLVGMSLQAFSQETVFQQEPLKIKSSDTKFISLGKGYYLDRISFEAKKGFFSEDSRLQIIIDGVRSVEVNVTKTGWRTYTANLSEFARVVEIRNVAPNGYVTVKNITVLPRRIHSTGPGYDYISSASDAYYQVAFIKNTVDYLYHVVTQEERAQYLDPFVVILGNSMAILETSSDLSVSSRKAVEDVVLKMKELSGFIDSMMQVPALSEVARELKSSQRLLEKMLQN